MRTIITLLTILLATSCNRKEANELRLPAEWEKQQQVHLAWYGDDRRDTVLCRVIEALQPDESITLNIPADTMKNSVISKLSEYNINTESINFVVDPYTDFWTRDPLFFVINNEKLSMTCFNYSMYGIFPEIAGQPLPDDLKMIGEYDQRLAAQLQIPTIKSDFVFEGGGIETNGKGTCMIIKEMALQRNSSKTIDEIEAELKRTLGAKKIIWLSNGFIEDRTLKNFAPFYKNYFGGGANMHIDELCRFIDEQSVVLPEIKKEDIGKSPVDSINYYMLEENYRILKNETTYDGKPLKIYRIPVPEIEQLKYAQPIDSNSIEEFKPFGFGMGDTIYRVPAASYINYFVGNKVVLIAKYWKYGMSESLKQKDEDVKNIFEKLFPDRKVIQISTLSINRGGGGIHCMTHEQPSIEN